MIADGEATPDGDGVVFRLVQPAERAQAEFFAGVLRQEIATMTAKIAKAEADWRRRCDEKGYVEPPCRIGVVLRRVEEATRMLGAIDERFLRTR
ncbi:hypothetical protein HZU40_30220 [Mycolicibacterium fluoranthenivorans]|uniref:Uncharacterized protein n=1 Tax=Mycolicibacterium fluoranthenivorans TaxID=258505 RepID=A0A1G4WU17_9MYCO|nr:MULTISPECIES: hypothetical protein [Mycobacteriaceae]MCV7255407.1 hypothetical protein [Mycobacterium hackensackense]QNJ92379.1 hypothetical protein HZU40_30220 [Mycolicibacterium fluoranthenivorans]SCX29560.1 hypothetical protein SAMN02799620_04817 [Mycolicibacterium fluoranthenivorans]